MAPVVFNNYLRHGVVGVAPLGIKKRRLLFDGVSEGDKSVNQNTPCKVEGNNCSGSFSECCKSFV